jgi:hypothetical protein
MDAVIAVHGTIFQAPIGGCGKTATGRAGVFPTRFWLVPGFLFPGRM